MAAETSERISSSASVTEEEASTVQDHGCIKRYRLIVEQISLTVSRCCSRGGRVTADLRSAVGQTQEPRGGRAAETHRETNHVGNVTVLVRNKNICGFMFANLWFLLMSNTCHRAACTAAAGRTSWGTRRADFRLSLL